MSYTKYVTHGSLYAIFPLLFFAKQQHPLKDPGGRDPAGIHPRGVGVLPPTTLGGGFPGDPKNRYFLPGLGPDRGGPGEGGGRTSP